MCVTLACCGQATKSQPLNGSSWCLVFSVRVITEDSCFVLDRGANPATKMEIFPRVVKAYDHRKCSAFSVTPLSAIPAVAELLLEHVVDDVVLHCVT